MEKSSLIVLIVVIVIVLMMVGVVVKIGIFYDLEPIHIFYGTVISHNAYWKSVSITVEGQRSFRYKSREFNAEYEKRVIYDDWFVLNTENGDLIDVWFDKKGYIIYSRIESQRDPEIEGNFIVECRSRKLERYLKNMVKDTESNIHKFEKYLENILKEK